MTAIKNFLKTILYKPFYNLLLFFAYIIPGHSMGWAIILLTFIVRGLLWVPSVKALQAPMKMRQYQDEIKQLQEKHKADRTVQAQALMAFYKEKGINPLSGCLPLIIQLPVILILYRVFIAGLKTFRPDLIYSFTPHLTTVNVMFLGADLSRPERIFLPATAAILQFLQTRHYNALNPTTPKKDDPQAMMMKQMQFIFPIMTFIIALSLPSGLALYWSATTLFSLLQQIYIARSYKEETPKVRISVRSKSS